MRAVAIPAAPRTHGTHRALVAALGCAAGTLLLTVLVAAGWHPVERADTDVVAAAVAWTTDHPTLAEPLDRIGVTSGKRILWPLSAVLAAMLWLTGRRFEGLLLASSIASTTVVTGGIKRTVSRDRPEWYVPEDPLPTSSFPSGHVALWVAFVVALLVILPLLLRGRVRPGAEYLATVPLLLLITVVSGQRVLQGRHYPSDVVAGALVGAGCALGCWVVLYALTQRTRLGHFAAMEPTPER